MRRLWILVLLLTMLIRVGWAQIPSKGNVFFGYSYDRTSVISNDSTNLNGWEATLEGKFLPWIGLVVDVDGHYGNHNFSGTSADVAAHNVLFGPRVYRSSATARSRSSLLALGISAAATEFRTRIRRSSMGSAEGWIIESLGQSPSVGSSIGSTLVSMVRARMA